MLKLNDQIFKGVDKVASLLICILLHIKNSYGTFDKFNPTSNLPVNCQNTNIISDNSLSRLNLLSNPG